MQNTSYDRLIGILCSVLDAYSAVLFLPTGEQKKDPEDRTYCITSAFSLGNSLNHNADIQAGRGLVGWILRNGEPLLVSNFDQQQNYLGYYTANEEQSIKAFMGCALPGGEGALCVDSKRQYSFSGKDQKMLHLFAELIAQMEMEAEDREKNGRTLTYYTSLRTIYELRRQYPRWADFLHRFLSLVGDMTGFSYSALFTRDPGRESYSAEGENMPLLQKRGGTRPSFPLTHGLVGWVFRNGKRVSSDGVDGSPEALLTGADARMPQFQTVLALPLVIQRQTRGVLCLAHETPMRINEITQDFVSMVAEHLALFLENLYVKCRLRDLHQQTLNADGRTYPTA